LRIFNYYRLILHQQTDSNSLLFSASYLNRLTAPIVFNFLFMIHNRETAYFAVMGDGGVIPIFGSYFFQVYFPMFVLIVCLATLFNVYSRILKCLNITRFQFDEDFSHSQIDEGKDIIARVRKQRQRHANSEEDLNFYRSRSRPKLYSYQKQEPKSAVTQLWNSITGNKNYKKQASQEFEIADLNSGEGRYTYTRGVNPDLP